MAVGGARRRMWAVETAAVVLGLLAMAEQSLQISLKNPLPRLAHRIKDEEPAFGIIVTSAAAEKALNDSGSFLPTSYVDLLGRRFVSGTILGANVVYVRSAGTPSVHAGITVQILVDNFNIRGIINYVSAGTTNETISIGTVVVPGHFAFTGAFQWLSKDSNQQGQLVIGGYNYPVNGQNLLGSLLYEEIDMYDAGKLEQSSWIPADPNWLSIASKIKVIDYSNCGFQSNCLVEVIAGLNASSSDIYVSNPAYREFLYKTFRVSTVDTSGAAIALGALSNDVPWVVFHGVSNKAGAGSGKSYTELANENAVKAVIRFIWLATVPRSAHY